MNTLLEDPRAATVVAPTRDVTYPSQRILVVEDNMAIRELNSYVLARSGYQVDGAEDGAAGWEVLQAGTFDLLITDHEMPRMSGLELVKRARSARMTLPIILATGMLPEEELERHPWLQLAATLLKPFPTEELLGTVKQVLRATERASFGGHSYSPLASVSLGHGSPCQHRGIDE